MAPAIAFVVLAGLSPALAQTAPATPNTGPTPDASQGVIHSWAVTPVGADPTKPGDRPNLTYELDRGQTLQDAVVVFNYSNVPLTFKLYATDAFNAPDTGEFSLLSEDEKATEAGSWIKVGESDLTLPARTSIQLPITVTVPNNATPGDHAAAVLAASLTPAVDASGGQVLLNRRTGTRVYIRVKGQLAPKLAVENVNTTYHGHLLNPVSGGLDVTYTVRNTGNVRLGATQHVAVTNILGRSMGSARPQAIAELLPGATVRQKVHLSDMGAWVRLKAAIRVTPIAVRNDQVKPSAVVHRGASTWAIPWLLLIIALLTWAIRKLYKRYRRQPEETASLPESEEPTPVQAVFT